MKQHCRAPEAYRFAVWSTAKRELRDDAVITFDEGYGDALEKFGPVKAHLWALSQAARSMPWGMVGKLAHLLHAFWRIAP